MNQGRWPSPRSLWSLVAGAVCWEVQSGVLLDWMYFLMGLTRFNKLFCGLLHFKSFCGQQFRDMRQKKEFWYEELFLKEILQEEERCMAWWTMSSCYLRIRGQWSHKHKDKSVTGRTARQKWM